MNQLLKLFFASCAVLALVSCGGGGGSASSDKTPDTQTGASTTTVNYVSADPEQIYLSSSGARDWSEVKFSTLGASGAIAAGASATVSLTKNPGGVGLGTAGSTSDLTLSSDSKGVIGFKIYAGNVPGPLEVKVSLTSSSAYAYSKNLTVLSGPPSQDRFSLSVETFNLEGGDWDGTTTSLMVRLADRQGNPVPVGTVVNFTSSGGQIGGSCKVELGSDGIASCKTTFSSQAPRATNGRVSILAYAEGLKPYVDRNSNNTYDASVDDLSDMGDAYRDDNENGSWDAGEFVILRGGTVTCTGAGAPTPSRKDTCTRTVGTTVRRQVVLFMSNSDAFFNAVDISSTELSFRLNDSESGLNPMPFNTSITTQVSDATADNGLSCTVQATTPAKVANVSPSWNLTDQLGTTHTISLSGCAAGDSVRVTITTPKKVETSNLFTIPRLPLSVANAVSVPAGGSVAQAISGGIPGYTAQSSDNTIATVSVSNASFTVTGVKAGVAYVTVSDSNGVSVTTKVTVN